MPFRFIAGNGARKIGLGAIAQLGERLHGMQEVSGSIPLGSTKFQVFWQFWWETPKPLPLTMNGPGFRLLP